jgi:hypothetical protein
LFVARHRSGGLIPFLDRKLLFIEFAQERTERGAPLENGHLL